MKLNRKKHLLLKHLTEKYIKQNEKYSSETKISGDLVGYSFEEIERKLNISPFQRALLESELYISKEIYPFELKYKGWMIDDNGITSYNEKKYLLKNRNIVKNWIKDFVQICIPILSLIITILVILKDNSKTNSETLELEKKVESLQNSVKTLDDKLNDRSKIEK